MSSEFDIVPIDALVFMPFKSRIEPESDIEDLAESVKQHGILEPVLVRPKPSGLLEVVAGERRVRAARKAGVIEVPVIVREMSDQETMEVQLVENLHRKDLSDYEKARWLNEMIKRYGYTQQALADKIGKTQGWISQHLRMMELEGIITRVIISRFTEGQARAVLSAPEDLRPQVAKWVESQPELPSADKIRGIILSLKIEEETQPTSITPGVTEEEEEPSKEVIARDIEKIDRQVRAEEEGWRPEPLPEWESSLEVEKIITNRLGEDLSIIKAALTEHGLTEEEADEALQNFKENFPDLWWVCYASVDEQDQPKTEFTELPVPETTVTPRKFMGRLPEKAVDREMDRALEWYPMSLVDMVWAEVHIASKRIPFLKAYVEVCVEEAHLYATEEELWAKTLVKLEEEVAA